MNHNLACPWIDKCSPPGRTVNAGGGDGMDLDGPLPSHRGLGQLSAAGLGR